MSKKTITTAQWVKNINLGRKMDEETEGMHPSAIPEYIRMRRFLDEWQRWVEFPTYDPPIQQGLPL